ncbi:MAG TPA: hypothetical protein VFZ62_00575 [Candidatus Saccharimonadales bacterium]
MSAHEPQSHPDVDPAATPADRYKVAPYSEPPKIGWEISPNPVKRGLTYLGLHDFRHFMIAVVSATLAVIVTLGVQAIFGNNDKSTDTGISGQVNYGDVGPDIFPPIEPNPALPPTALVNVYVSPEIYKKLPTDLKTNPFCRAAGNSEPCYTEQHIFEFEKLLDKRQISYLYRVVGASPEYDEWSFIEVTDWKSLKALPGDISADYGPNSTLEQVKIYLK